MKTRMAVVVALTIAAGSGLYLFAADDPPTPEQANALYLKSDWANAAKAYEALTKDQPKVPNHWHRLGVCRLALKENEAAATAFETAIANGGVEGPNRYQLALAKARLGDKSAALDQLEKAEAQGAAKSGGVAQEVDFAALRKDPRYLAVMDRLEHRTRGMKGADLMDHWVGEWDVYSNGQKVGQNRIIKSLDGFAVEEFWESSTFGRGRSLFVFEVPTGTWRQLWTSDAGWVIQKVGTPVENGILLEGTSAFANGTTKKTREHLTRNPDGTVRQHMEDWDETNKRWNSTFDAKYVRKTG
jgi:hypothetical protein